MSELEKHAEGPYVYLVLTSLTDPLLRFRFELEILSCGQAKKKEKNKEASTPASGYI